MPVADMDPDEAARQVRRIKQAASDGDAELAHQMEDRLYKDVLSWIVVNGDEKSARLAHVARGAAELDFQRWYG